jgi:hypothetical protein
MRFLFGLICRVIGDLPILFGRHFAASLGLTPLQDSSGGKERMGRISLVGDRYLRRLSGADELCGSAAGFALVIAGRLKRPE